MPKPADLFLSYHGADRKEVATVRRHLEARGISTFLDRESLIPGRSWPDDLEEALSGARAVAVFFGPHGFGPWQKREMIFALERQGAVEERGGRLPVMPVLLPGADPRPAFILQNTWVDLRFDVEDPGGLDRLAAAVRGGELPKIGLLAVSRISDPETQALLLAGFDDDIEPVGGVAVAREVAEKPIRVSTRRQAVTASFSPDGSTYVAVCSDGCARIYRTDGFGEGIVVKSSKKCPIVCAAHVLGGEEVAAGRQDGSILQARADGSGRPRRRLPGHRGPVTGLAVSPDGSRFVSVSEDGSARLWRADSRGEPVELPGHEGPVRCAAFSPDGSRIVTASEDGTARVWPAGGRSEPVVLRGHEGAVRYAVFDPDSSRVVTASEDGTARIWGADGRGELAVLEGHEGAVNTAAFSPDGSKIVTASEDKSARLWDADTSDWEKRGEINLFDFTDAVVSAAYSPDGSRLLAASRDGTAQIIFTLDFRFMFQTPVELELGGRCTCAVFSPDGSRIVTCVEGGHTGVWNGSGAGEPVRLTRAAEDGMFETRRPAFDFRASRIVTAVEQALYVWRLDGPRNPVVFEDPRPRSDEPWGFDCAALSPDGSRVVGCVGDGSLLLFDSDGSGEPMVLKGHDKQIRDCNFSPDGSRFVTASADGTARVRKADGSGRARILRGHDGAVQSAVFSPDGAQILTASTDGTVRLWPVRSRAAPIVFEGHRKGLYGAVFDEQGSRFVSFSADHTARVWNAEGSGEPVVLKDHQSDVTRAAFSPDGLKIVTCCYNTVRVWNADGSGEPVVFLGHEEVEPTWVNCAVFSPDGSHVLSATDEILIWKADGTGKPMLLKGSRGEVIGAAYSPDGSRVVSIDTSFLVIVWRVGWRELLRYLSGATSRCLHPWDRSLYLGETPREARARYEECSRRHGRKPLKTDFTPPPPPFI